MKTDVLTLALKWAEDEVFSSKFFILFGVLFVSGAIGFWQMGKSEVAKAFIHPLWVCGVLLIIVGIGLVYTNYKRMESFPEEHAASVPHFVNAEMQRANKTVAEYERIVFTVIPLIIVAAALMLIFLNTPLWRALSISIIGMMVIILFIDSNAHSRMKSYQKELVIFQKQYR